MSENNHHLNMFFPYRNELGEKNLTRALLILLRIVSDDLRRKVIGEMIGKKTEEFNIDGDIDFILESALKPPNCCKNKFLVGISTTGEVEDDGEKYDGSSIPDAQIRVDSGAEMVLLIESKIGINPLKLDQMERHAKILEIPYGKNCHTTTWYSILGIVEEELESAKLPHEQEFVCEQFCEFLKMNEYNIMKTFDMPSFSEDLIEDLKDAVGAWSI